VRKALATLAMPFVPGLCRAAALSPDPTGIWFDPDESGWGMSLAQQGDTVFALLFVYDSTGHPVWYVAPGLRPPASNPPGGPMATGALYRTVGPWFGTSFDPHAVGTTPVGTLTLQSVQPSQQSLQVGYVIDGTTVSKSVQPQTWGDDSALLFGSYEGGLRITGRSSPACDDVALGPIDASRAFNFQVTASTAGGAGQLQFIWGTGIDTACRLAGTYVQRGQLGTVAGAMACGEIGGTALVPGPNDDSVRLTDLAIGEHGFSGRAEVTRGSCTYTGHIGGVRLP